MSDIFDIECSVYESSKDNSGKYVDRETGECIQQMTIREFCLTDRWKPVVDRLRQLIAEHGAVKAKAMQEYKQTKLLLPGATLSGLFELRQVEETAKDGHKYQMLCSRRTAHLKQHTGFICIDIDYQDNMSLADMNVVLRTLRHRPEVALVMKSCSGTGYFALIQLAYPQYHKEQFAALQRDYKALGITVDRQCSDVTRVRFASYDDSPYVNLQAIPYSGIELGQQMLAPRAAVYTQHTETTDDTVAKVERMVEKIEHYGIDITNSYADWFKVGFSLHTLPEPFGRQFFHRVSAMYKGYNATETDKKYDTLRPDKIGIGTFFAICKQYGITLR